jgi:hypothetical protein
MLLRFASERDMLFTGMLYPTIRAVLIHIGKSPTFLAGKDAASMGFNEIGLQILSLLSDSVVGGADATGPALEIQHIQSPRLGLFQKIQKVGVGK